nr:helix-turn-helix domain-containing protein [Rhodococcus sp. X156]
MRNSRTVSGQRIDSIQGAAAYVGVDPKTIRRWIAAGHIQGFRAGPRLIRVSLDEIDAMMRPIPAAVVA